MPTIDANGETLAYTSDGIGPAVVLLHGVGATGATWAPATAALTGRYALYAFDMRGHGGSTVNGVLSTDDMARDVEVAADALGLDRYHLVGCSLGAAVAVHLAALDPDRVASLVVAGVGLVPDQVVADEVYGIREAVHYLADDDFADQIAEALLIPDTPPDRIEGLRDGIRTMTKQTYLKALEAMAMADLSSVGGKVAAPALVLHGALDELVPPEQAAALAGALADATLQTLSDAGHVAYLDDPIAFGAALAGFLDAQA